MLAKYGIPLPEFSRFIEVALGGEVVSQVYDQGRSFDVTVKMDDADRSDMERIGNLTIDGTAGKVPLSYVADIVSTSGPNAISRENAQRKIVVSANVADRDLHSVVGDIQEMIREKVDLPEGYHIEYGGQFESEQAASRVLSLMSIISLLIIFLLLFQEFRSLSVSGIIMLNLPLALIGGIVRHLADQRGGQHPGDYRLHFAVRHCDAQRHTPCLALQSTAQRGHVVVQGQRGERIGCSTG